MRVKRKGELEHFLGRRYGDFARLHKQLRTELPGKVLPPLPKKNKSSTTATGLFSRGGGDGDDSEASSVSSMSTMPPASEAGGLRESMKNLTVRGHRRELSTTSSRNASPRPSMDGPKSPNLNSPKPDVSEHVLDCVVAYTNIQMQTTLLWRESQRISLRAFLRYLLQSLKRLYMSTIILVKHSGLPRFIFLKKMTSREYHIQTNGLSYMYISTSV